MNKKILIIIGGILLVVIFIVLLLSGGNQDISEIEELGVKLEYAAGKLKAERAKLDSLTEMLRRNNPLGATVQDQINASKEIVAKTNLLFIDAYSQNPQVKTINTLNDLLLEQQRKQINDILTEWKRLEEASALSGIDLTQSYQVKSEIELIRTYIQNIQEAVENLTTENSGLSQYQIDSYISSLPNVDEITQIINTLNVAIESSTPSALGGGTSNTASSQSPTFEEIVAQQNAVAQAQNQVNTIEQQISSANPVPAPTPPQPVPVTSTIPEVYVEPTAATFTPPPTPTSTFQKVEGIIVQPGPVRLIQGTDPY